jgi:hypothetical protein
MRDKRFVAVHRGGQLSKEHHRLLMRWARDCAEHVLPLLEPNIDKRLTHALATATAWEKGEASVGEAQKAAVAAHAVAREASSPVTVAIARAVGHAVATAHMADHSLGPAYYALQAVKAADKSTEQERHWQDEHIPSEIRALVLSGLANKFPKRNQSD